MDGNGRENRNDGSRLIHGRWFEGNAVSIKDIRREAAKGMLGGAKFNVGDKVVSKSAPDGGVGTVEKSKYDKGWWYYVRMQGGLLYTPESDLEPALMVQSV